MSEYSADAAYDRGEAVCVIGAGASGLAALKNLRERGFEVDCYESDTEIGGAWNARKRSSPMSNRAHSLTSRTLTEFPDFPMPDDWPDFPHHRRILEYLEHYADHFGLRDSMWFGSEIERIEPADQGRFDVIVKPASGSAARRLRYAAVVMANGHDWSPYTPHFPGMEEFSGELVHSSTCRDPARLRGRKVLIVGGGNSGSDLAAEAATAATTCWHSCRRGYWRIPKYLSGRPADQYLLRFAKLPRRARLKAVETAVRKAAGDPRRNGGVAPDHRLDQSLPVFNSLLPYWTGHGAVQAKPDVACFDGRRVVFTDDTWVEPDLTVMATGFRPRFDFCEPALLGGLDDEGYPQLYAHVFSPVSETLFAVGLLEPDSALLPLAHWQSVAVAKWLSTRRSDPERAAAFRNRVMSAAQTPLTEAPQLDSPRHRLAVGTERYLDVLEGVIDALDAAPKGSRQ